MAQIQGVIQIFCGHCFKQGRLNVLNVKIMSKDEWHVRCHDCNWKPKTKFEMEWWFYPPDKPEPTKEEIDGNTGISDEPI